MRFLLAGFRGSGTGLLSPTVNIVLLALRTVSRLVNIVLLALVNLSPSWRSLGFRWTLVILLHKVHQRAGGIVVGCGGGAAVASRADFKGVISVWWVLG